MFKVEGLTLCVSKPARVLIYGSSFAMAFCSMGYELVLAQCLSISMGNSILRYSMTIGFFVFSLGLGSILSEKVPREVSFQALLLVEMGLGVVGLLAPLLILGADYAIKPLLTGVHLPYDSIFASSLVWVICHSPVFGIGILSGFEVPLLTNIIASSREPTAGEASRVLAYDYLGMFCSALFFPFVVYRQLGLVYGALLFSFVNVGSALALILFLRARKSKVEKFFAGLVILALLNLALLAQEDKISFFLSQIVFVTARGSQ